jgi:hypothetical protein
MIAANAMTYPYFPDFDDTLNQDGVHRAHRQKD